MKIKVLYMLPTQATIKLLYPTDPKYILVEKQQEKLVVC